MRTSPFFSVCVPTFNGERFLASCLESIRAQSFKDIEIILGDDASTDSTAYLLERFRAETSGFNIVFNRSSRNLGLAASWQKCLLEARGEYVKFLFQDDVMKPECLSELAKRLQQQHTMGIGMVFSACAHINEFGVETGVHEPFTADRFFKSGSLTTHLVWKGNCVGAPSVTAFRRSAAVELGGFDLRLNYATDFEFYARLSDARPVLYVRDKLVEVREHNDSATATLTRLGLTDSDVALAYRIMRENGTGPQTMLAVRRRLHALYTRSMVPRRVREGEQ